MLAAVLIWLYVFFLAYMYGKFSLERLSSWLILNEAQLDLPLIFLAGLTVLTTLGSLLSLFIKIGLLADLLLMLGAIAILLWGRVKLDWRLPAWGPWVWGLFGLTILLTLENATHAPVNPDTAIYHAQSIRWIETYRAVPGLGNLNPRLAFNSSWLLLNALFSFSFLSLRSFHLVSGALFLAFSVYSLDGLNGLLKRDFRPSNWFKLALLPLGLYTLGSELSSPGTDFPTALLTWMLLGLSLEILERQPPRMDARAALLFVLSIFIITIKVSAVPLVLLALAVLLVGWWERGFRWGAKLIGLGMIVLLPWLARNLILSGYLIFPLPQPQLFHFDWRVPYSVVLEQSRTIRDFARGIQSGGSSSYLAWVRGWWLLLTANQRLIVSLAFLSPLTFLALWAVKKKTDQQGLRLKAFLALWLAAYIGLLFWFFSAPALRFGYGFIFGSLLMAGLPWMEFARKWLERRGFWLPVLSGLLLTGFISLELLLSFQPATIANRWLLPTDYLPPHVQSCQLDDQSLFCSKVYRQCGYQAFPCVPELRVGTELRGDSFQQGFRSTRP